MSKDMIISPSPHETKVALLEDGQVVEFYIEREQEIGLVGSIYKGRVTRVLPGMQSAFIDIGLERDAFLYVSDFFEGLEDYEPGSVPELTSPADSEPVESEPAEAETPPEEIQPPPEEKDEDRQPAYLMEEPPLKLPEQRPHQRARQRGSRPRRRSGRRPLRGRPRSGDRRPERRDDTAPPAPVEPIILPGESLARYRDRPSTPEPEPAAEAAKKAPANIEARETREADAKPSPTDERQVPVPAETPPTEEAASPEVPAGEAPAETPEAEPEPQVKGVAEAREEVPATDTPVEDAPVEEAGAEEPQGVAEEAAADSTPEEKSAPEPETGEAAEEAPPAEPADEPQPVAATEANGSSLPEGYPDAMTLAEIQRVRQYEDQVALPPSLKERTAGGVEWDKRRRASRSREGDGRRTRGRGRGRPDRSPRASERRPRRDARTRGGRRPRQDRRPTPARPSRGQPAIAELLKAGQEIIVQIAKEQMGKKGARITSHVTLPGRFLVYMPTIDHIGISRRIGTSEERSRLRRLLLQLKGSITGGFVVRTAAADCSEDDLRRDIDYLIKLWHDMRVQADEGPAPMLLHRDLSLVQRLLRDQLTNDYNAVWVDTEEEYTKIVDLVAQFQPELTRRIKLFTKPEPIFEEMGVQQEIDRAIRPKVWLKSGGYIVINQTEALVAIDVNTGKFVGKGSTRLEDTIVKTNLEAIEEVVRQIRLRDLGGIIVIDFIDMEDSRNRNKVMRALEAALRNDRSPSKLLSFNEFGLVAITRKRSRQSLERLLCQPCPTCTGTGNVKSIQTLGYEIQSEALKMAETIDAPELTIRAHPEIVRALKSRDNTLVREMEESTGKNIILQSDNALHIEEYNIY